MPSTTTIPAFTIIGFNATVNNQNLDAIGALWQRFHQTNFANQLPERLSEDFYCLYHRYQGDHIAPYDLCIGYEVTETAAIPEGLTRIVVPEQIYQVYPVKGAMPQALIAQWQAIWSSDIPRAYQVDFDRYHSQDAAQVEVHIGLIESH